MLGPLHLYQKFHQYSGCLCAAPAYKSCSAHLIGPIPAHVVVARLQHSASICAWSCATSLSGAVVFVASIKPDGAAWWKGRMGSVVKSLSTAACLCRGGDVYSSRQRPHQRPPRAHPAHRALRQQPAALYCCVCRARALPVRPQDLLRI